MPTQLPSPWNDQEWRHLLFEGERELASDVCFSPTVPDVGPNGPDLDVGLPPFQDSGSIDPGPMDVETDPSDSGGDPDDPIDPSLVYYGSLNAETNEELAVLTGKHEVTGHLYITEQVSDLTPIENLRRVGETFGIGYSQVDSLMALGNLESVNAQRDSNGGAISISYNSQLRSTAGLSSLRHFNGWMLLDLTEALGETKIESLDALEVMNASLHIQATTVTGLSSLQRILGDVRVHATHFNGLGALNELAGSLCIDGPFVQANGFGALTRIGGMLIIQSGGVPQFPSLRTVGTTLKVRSPTLQILSGFPVLTEIGVPGVGGCPPYMAIGVEVEGCDALTRIEGFPQLTRIGCNGTFGIRQNLSLVAIDAFSGLLEIPGTFRIEVNPQLKTIKGFGALDTVRHDFIIRNNSLLETIAPFSALRRIGCTLSIQENPVLLNAGGFPLLTEFWQCGYGGDVNLEPSPRHCAINIYDNAALPSLPAFLSLTDCGYIRIENCGELSNLHGLSALTNAGNIFVSQNASFVNFAGLDALRTLEDLYVAQNQSLAGLSGLNALTQVRTLTLQDNDGLVSLAALSGLVEIASFRFLENDTFASLGGVLQGATVGTVSVRDNMGLDQCDVEEWFRSLNDGTGSRGSVYNNGGQPNCPD